MSRQSAELDRIEHDIDETRHRIDDTLGSLADKVSASRLLGDALDSVRDNGGEFAGNLVRAIRENPVAATMAVTGVAWMLFSDRNRRPDDVGDHEAANEHEDPYEDLYGDAGERPYTAAGAPDLTVAGPVPDETTPAALGYPVAGSADLSMGDRVRAGTDRASSTASGGVHALSDGARKAGDKARETARDAATRAGDAAWQTKAAAGKAADSARATAHDLRDRAARARQAAGRRTGDVYAGARDVTRRAGGFLADNPLMIGALGLAIGGVVAAALPPTRREDEWLGETGDRVRDDAAAAARRAAREGSEVARAAARSAKEEAERQKLTPDGVREAAGQAVRGGAEVARTAVRTAEDETRRRSTTGGDSAHQAR